MEQGYKLSASYTTDVFGVKIYTQSNIPLSKETESFINKASYEIYNSLWKDNVKANNNFSEEKQNILALFDSPIFAEEIPNGYCSQP